MTEPTQQSSAAPSDSSRDARCGPCGQSPDAAPRGASASPSPPADETVHCVECAYDLRGLPHDGRCPECGTEIRQTLEFARRHNAAAACREVICMNGTVLGIVGVAAALMLTTPIGFMVPFAVLFVVILGPVLLVVLALSAVALRAFSCRRTWHSASPKLRTLALCLVITSFAVFVLGCSVIGWLMTELKNAG